MAYIPWWQRMSPPTFTERFDLGGLAGRLGNRQPQRRLKAAGPLLLAPYLLPYAAAFIGTTATGLLAQQKIQNYFENNPDAMPKFKEWISSYIPAIHGGEGPMDPPETESFPKEDWSKSFGTGEGTKNSGTEKRRTTRFR